MPEHVVLGFDFGMKRIGVAVGQTITCTATPLPPLTAHDGIPDWQLVEHLVTEWRPTELLVGIPLTMDGHTQTITFAAQRFANRLQEKMQLPVQRVDERLTTAEARQQLFEQGGYKKLSRSSIDSAAAVLIIETYLGALLHTNSVHTHSDEEKP